jgi:hypothetical protein
VRRGHLTNPQAAADVPRVRRHCVASAR